MKKYLNNDDQQFHQYQQLTLTSNHWTQISTTYVVGNPGPGLW